MVHNGTATRPLSLASGHALLAEAAAGVCGYSPATFATQRKLVLAYWAGMDSGPLTFSICNSGHFLHNFWLLGCPRPLETRDGADAAAERCWCALPLGYRPCATGAHGFGVDVDTMAGHW